METTTVTTNGRVTIPQKLRKKYKIKPGTRIYFTEEKGEIKMEANTPDLIRNNWGLLGTKGRMLKALIGERKHL